MSLNQQLQNLFGAHLLAIYAYGVPQENILVVIDHWSNVRPGIWEAYKFRKSAKSIKVFTLDELKCSLDVFPVEFLDMKAARELLYGEDLLSALRVDAKNLRYECEFYLRAYLLSLREGLLKGASIRYEIRKFKPAFVRLLPRLLNLSNTEPSHRFVSQLKQLSDHFGLNYSAFEDIFFKTQNADSLDAFLTQLNVLIRKINDL